MSPPKLPAELRHELVVPTIDTREHDPAPLSLGPPVRIGMPTGDYGLLALPHVCAIERKSEPDFLACVGVERERFDREVMRLFAFPVRALVVESTWERIEAGNWRSKVTSAAAMGSLVGWAAMGL